MTFSEHVLVSWGQVQFLQSNCEERAMFIYGYQPSSFTKWKITHLALSGPEMCVGGEIGYVNIWTGDQLIARHFTFGELHRQIEVNAWIGAVGFAPSAFTRSSII